MLDLFITVTHLLLYGVQISASKQVPPASCCIIPSTFHSI
uniref:Uncharacterized protein n=1 Tax=Arundo donax TaxID=35708 RepID=A0A0A8YFR2_ARUDO